MASLTQWLADRLAGKLTPQQKKRVERLADVIQQQLEANQKRFTMRAVLASVSYDPVDIPLATEAVLHRFLERFWADEHFSPQEMRTAEWLAQKLDVPPHRILEINLDTAKDLFGKALAQAMEDGVLDPHEEQRLAKIAGSVGRTPAQLGARFFRADGAMFLRAIFSQMIEDETVTREGWSKLFAAAGKLGLRKEELLAAIRPQAQACAEMFLAEAKLDGLLSVQEEAGLDWMTAEWGLPPAFIDYLHQETARLRKLTQVTAGELADVAAPEWVKLAAGERAHYSAPAERFAPPSSATEEGGSRIRGSLVLTNQRLWFSTGANVQAIDYGKILAHIQGRNYIKLELDGLAPLTLVIDDPAMAYAVLHSAIAHATRMRLLRSDDALPAIPRDTLQRVWNRCGGKCVQCSGTEYLEFDHVVPVYRGGTSTDENLRLLCRPCEAKNTDFA